MGFQRLRDDFELVAKYGDSVPLYMFSDMLLRAPHLRESLPIPMKNKRDRLMTALAFVVENSENLSQITRYLQRLARGHRKFGIEREHYALWSTSGIHLERFASAVTPAQRFAT